MKTGELLQNPSLCARDIETEGETDHRPAKPFQLILLVDDDVYIRQLARKILTRFGFRVDTANDGAAAWKMLQSNKFDLLLTDQTMPIVSGVELIRKTRAAHMTLPVILMSGGMTKAESEQYPSLQINDFLAKPYTVEELVATVEKSLGVTAPRP